MPFVDKNSNFNDWLSGGKLPVEGGESVLFNDQFAGGDFVALIYLDEVYPCIEAGEVQFRAQDGRLQDRGAQDIVDMHGLGGIRSGYDLYFTLCNGVRVQFEPLNIPPVIHLLGESGSNKKQ